MTLFRLAASVFVAVLTCALPGAALGQPRMTIRGNVVTPAIPDQVLTEAIAVALQARVRQTSVVLRSWRLETEGLTQIDQWLASGVHVTLERCVIAGELRFGAAAAERLTLAEIEQRVGSTPAIVFLAPRLGTERRVAYVPGRLEVRDSFFEAARDRRERIHNVLGPAYLVHRPVLTGNTFQGDQLVVFGTTVLSEGLRISRNILSPGSTLLVELGDTWLREIDAADFASSPMQLEMSDTHIGGATDFSQTEFVRLFVCQRCIFEGPVSGRSARFPLTSFRHTTFVRDVDFSGAEFTSSLIIEVTEFNADVRFTASQVNGDAWFDSCVFQSRLDLTSAAVGGGLSFLGTRLGTELGLDSTRISGSVIFNGADWPSDARVEFGGAQSGGPITGLPWHRARELLRRSYSDEQTTVQSWITEAEQERQKHLETLEASLRSADAVFNDEAARRALDYLRHDPDELTRTVRYARVGALAFLENGYRIAGFRSDELAAYRERKRAERTNKSLPARITETVFVDATCGYGTRPDLVLAWAALWIVGCAAIYATWRVQPPHTNPASLIEPARLWPGIPLRPAPDVTWRAAYGLVFSLATFFSKDMEGWSAQRIVRPGVSVNRRPPFVRIHTREGGAGLFHAVAIAQSAAAWTLLALLAATLAKVWID